MPTDRKALLRQYKETKLPMGVFRVRNIAQARSFIGVSVNLPGMLNRMRFQLDNSAHPNRALQADWDRLGPDAFVIEALDELEPPEEPGYYSKLDLEELRQMWIERLTAEGESLYT
ncbi:MAG TPA: GIY-YIG nuclease family protein [Coriobacteriia bacterium]|nr:GIY-YIG nuclease family protein [Coriobacteriia bacterium]